MLENIRRIGIFMIAAQTIIHFAPGKQYEKYLKIIAGVIVLLQFLSPFVASAGEIAASWQAQAERMMAELEGQEPLWQGTSYGTSPVEDAVLQQIQEEIKSRLNDAIAKKSDRVTAVSIELEAVETEKTSATGNHGRDFVFRYVRVTMRHQGEAASAGRKTDAGQEIRIEEITVGGEREKEAAPEEGEGGMPETLLQEYRSLFAQTLGITEERVEVEYLGGG